MIKDEENRSNKYLELLDSKPWERMENYFGDRTQGEPIYIDKIDINPEKWIQFSVDNFDLAKVDWERTRDYQIEEADYIAKLNNELGRDIGNSFEVSFGYLGDSNKKLVNLLGDDNINKLGLEKDTLLARMIIHTPGHSVAWHEDNPLNGYKMAFPDIEIDPDRVIRYWFSAIDWVPGQVFEVGETVISSWNAGDVWQIPFGVPHAVANFGYHIKFSVSLTGHLKK